MSNQVAVSFNRSFSKLLKSLLLSSAVSRLSVTHITPPPPQSPPVSSRIFITSSGSRPQLIVCIISHRVGSDHGPWWWIPIVSVDHDNGWWITAAADHGGSWSRTKKSIDCLTIYLLLVASIALLSVLEEGSLAWGSSFSTFFLSKRVL